MGNWFEDFHFSEEKEEKKRKSNVDVSFVSQRTFRYGFTAAKELTILEQFICKSPFIFGISVFLGIRSMVYVVFHRLQP